MACLYNGVSHKKKIKEAMNVFVKLCMHATILAKEPRA
jgi:hypothetical protein